MEKKKDFIYARSTLCKGEGGKTGIGGRFVRRSTTAGASHPGIIAPLASFAGCIARKRWFKEKSPSRSTWSTVRAAESVRKNAQPRPSKWWRNGRTIGMTQTRQEIWGVPASPEHGGQGSDFSSVDGIPEKKRSFSL